MILHTKTFKMERTYSSVTFSWKSVVLSSYLYIGLSVAIVFTSTKKIENMVLKEAEILESLHIDVLHLAKAQVHLKFSDFYVHRMAKVKERDYMNEIASTLNHPNGAYQWVMEFYTEYQKLREILRPHTSQSLEYHLGMVPSYADVLGARRSLLRIQKMYRLNSTDMAMGSYLIFQGPSLSARDAYDIGDRAFQDNFFNLSSQWLTTSLNLWDFAMDNGQQESKDLQEVKLKSLLGRALLRIGEKEKATALLKEVLKLDPNCLDVIDLKLEVTRGINAVKNPSEEEMENHVCTWNITGQYVVANPDPSTLFCQYRPARPPYYRFKQEILSLSPFVCLYYDVINDKERESLIDQASRRLERSMVMDLKGSQANEGRISDLTFIWDKESETVSRISQRVGAMTSLNIYQDPDEKFYAGEPQQVVNYGIGGHYGVHSDIFTESVMSNLEQHAKESGNRIATFLIYLTDVDRGGATVFPSVGIHVKPKANTALFWYNLEPSGEVDLMTSHAGCPMLAGHKWVSNKWIWTYGNVFTRRCGLRQDSTQWDIEQEILRDWR